MLSKDQVIALAACPICCAFRGEQCTFIRADDPWGRRTYAKQSHTARITIAKDHHEKTAENDLNRIANSLRL